MTATGRHRAQARALLDDLNQYAFEREPTLTREDVDTIAALITATVAAELAEERRIHKARWTQQDQQRRDLEAENRTLRLLLARGIDLWGGNDGGGLTSDEWCADATANLGGDAEVDRLRRAGGAK